MDKRTRIPISLLPLPALPHRLLNLSARLPLDPSTSSNENGTNEVQGPTGLDYAGPSNLCRSVDNRPFRVDDVTMGSPGENRRMSETSVIYISSDEEHDSNEKGTFLSAKDCLASNRRIAACTPALNTLQSARKKNIKRLKRPRSREGTALPYHVELNEIPRRRLNFNQTIRDRMQSPDFFQKSYVEREYSSEIFSYLLQTETETKTVSLARVKSDRRTRVINWMIKINGVDGNPATIQTAIWYLDAALASDFVTLNQLQLTAAASLLIAAKIHGAWTCTARLFKYTQHGAFTKERLLQTEELTLVGLEFPRQPVIPQEFISYFAWWCNTKRPRDIELAAEFLCLCGMTVHRILCAEYPSVVAAASIVNALLLLKKDALIPTLKECPAYVAAEKKAEGDLSQTCAILRHAVRVVAANFSYKILMEQYGVPINYIVQTVVSAANDYADLAVMKLINTVTTVR